MSNINNPSMIKALIRKDWYFNKNILMFSYLIGLVSVAMLSFESRVFYVGMILLISIVILIGALLATTTVINEIKNKTLPFLLSMPITCMDYTKAKLIFNLSSYFIIWLTLLLTTIGVIYYTQHLPNGLIPYALILMIELLVAFILILSTALISDSEKWTIVIMTITNVGFSLFMFLIASIESINKYMNGPEAVWNNSALMIIATEIFICALIIAITLFKQSRKKDFI